MRCACIDIGSNTTRLLVADPGEGALREVLSRRVFAPLRRHPGTIPPDVVASVAATVAEHVAAARAAGAEAVRAVGTAAVRGASNADELCAAVRERCGVEVEVLSCEDEARLAFLGATRTLAAPPAGRVAVVDVGGGSTEIVCGTVAGGVEWSVSLPFGSGVLADAHCRSDPPSEAELDALRAHVAREFADVAPPPVEAAYAVGGSATSLWRLIGGVLGADALRRGLGALCAAPSAQIASTMSLHPDRVRMLPAGIVVLRAAGERLGVALAIGAGGLREGVIFEQLATSQSP